MNLIWTTSTRYSNKYKNIKWYNQNNSGKGVEYELWIYWIRIRSD